MRPYIALRDWVDRRWRDIGTWRVLALPLPVAGLVGLLLDLPMWVVFGFFLLWTSFIGWRWTIYLREESAKADAQFDKAGKYKLAKEYWTTESATAARKRKKKNG